MVWTDRLRTGRYESPSGESFDFEFFELSREQKKKAPEKPLFGGNSSDIEDLGNLAPTYPITVFFTGADYDLVSDRFFSALTETGPGVLRHPRWGNLKVLPLSVAQKENFVDGARRATFEIEFKFIEDLAFPVTSKSKESNVFSFLDLFLSGASEFFADALSILTLDDENAVTKTFNAITSVVSSTLGPLVAGTEAVNTAFNTTINTVDTSISELLSSPAALAENYIRLTRLPSRASATITAKLSGYAAVFATIFSTSSPFNTDEMTYTDRQKKNYYLQQELMGFSIVAGMLESALAATYSAEVSDLNAFFSDTDNIGQSDRIIFNRGQVFAIVDQLNTVFNELVSELDSRQNGLSNLPIDQIYEYSPETLNFIKNALVLTIEALRDRSFRLKVERSVVLTTARTPLDLCYELYGDVSFLDFFITSNKFVAEELLLVPSGRTVIFYE